MVSQYREAYCSLNSVIEQLNLDRSADVSLVSAQTTIVNTQSANTKSYLTRLIYEVSGYVATDQGRSFVPYYATAYYGRGDLGSNRILLLHDDLLELDTLVNGDGSTLTSTEYRTIPRNYSPKYGIEILTSASAYWQFANQDSEITVTGWFGYHGNPSGMYTVIETVGGAGITDSATTLAVSDGGEYEILDYIRIEDEILLITGISANTLTLERGKQGTTAVAHTSDKNIQLFKQSPEVEQAVRRLVIRIFQNRAEIGDIIVVGDGAYQVNKETVRLNLNNIKVGRV